MFYISDLLIVFLLFSNPEKETQIKEYSTPCIIYPDNGVNNIIIGSSEFVDVMNEFGKATIRKKWHKRVEIFARGTGGYERYIKYDSLGLYFSNFTFKKNRTNSIRTIIVSENCPCKTENDIGIGNTVEELIAAYGENYSKSIEPDSRIAIYYNTTAYYVDKFEPKGKIFGIRMWKVERSD